MVNSDYDVKKLTDGLLFSESPRWRDGKLYVSDMIGARIYVVNDEGNEDVLKELPNQPNGMSFNGEGVLVYGTMSDKQLWSYDPKTEKHGHHADMSNLMQGYTGDTVIDSRGRMYVDDVGARVLHGEEPRAGRILLVEPNGDVKVAHEDVFFPNGITIDSTGENLYLMETLAYQLNHFKIREDGTLYDRKIIWNVKDYSVAPEDAMWLSMLEYNHFIRRDTKTGKITNVINVDGEATACTLGGEDGKTIYLVVNKVPKGGNFFEHMVQKGRLARYTPAVSKSARTRRDRDEINLQKVLSS